MNHLRIAKNLLSRTFGCTTLFSDSTDNWPDSWPHEDPAETEKSVEDFLLIYYYLEIVACVLQNSRRSRFNCFDYYFTGSLTIVLLNRENNLSIRKALKCFSRAHTVIVVTWVSERKRGASAKSV
uniref:Uncharacterized protein n=1 Tax=Romanomermis culicivorax TaxID=13658 RepID=A0A915JN03_ROMCU